MKPKTHNPEMATTGNVSMTELLIQADGTVLAHNLTQRHGRIVERAQPIRRTHEATRQRTPTTIIR